jgi:hypothetical protein
MSTIISPVIEPLLKRKIFATEEEAIRTLTQQYILQQIATLQQTLDHFEQKYGMGFQQFTDYLHERSLLLEKGQLTVEQRRMLGQAIMQEEDDWLDWKVTGEMLESWLGIRQEVPD